MIGSSTIISHTGPATALKLARVRPSRARGQNFLVQASVAAQIVDAAEVSANDTVVEIGPGLGILTERIVDAGPGRLILVEIDTRLASILSARFDSDSRVEILHRDFLAVTRSELGGERLKIIANLPFSTAAAILQHLCNYRDSITRMVLMFQREVAERIRAVPGSRNYSALSVFSSLYWSVIAHFRVAGGSFHPRPKVDAGVLIMEPRVPLDFDGAEEAAVLATVRAAFAAPRKTIRNSLAAGLRLNTLQIEAALESANIDSSTRPGMLDRSQLIALARILRPSAAAPHRA
ncbi:MAG TPA: 16S rRNA (adenine(1518)-N(6)/adenine(1519)-N(6))-dimethyltransferase RsmA [Candidatus Binataceae bacterium]|nr:16S rRNA (adenine(1518)-N(6)/adenine(1519)-N(6))-dimethyltransferase RsmA [Candidatus Binataceae bacterium]